MANSNLVASYTAKIRVLSEVKVEGFRRNHASIWTDVKIKSKIHDCRFLLIVKPIQKNKDVNGRRRLKKKYQLKFVVVTVKYVKYLVFPNE